MNVHSKTKTKTKTRIRGKKNCAHLDVALHLVVNCRETLFRSDVQNKGSNLARRAKLSEVFKGGTQNRHSLAHAGRVSQKASFEESSSHGAQLLNRLELMRLGCGTRTFPLSVVGSPCRAGPADAGLEVELSVCVCVSLMKNSLIEYKDGLDSWKWPNSPCDLSIPESRADQAHGPDPGENLGTVA